MGGRGSGPEHEEEERCQPAMKRRCRVTAGRHHTTRTQEHPDAITPQGPRSTRTPSHHKDPGAPGRHHTTRTQEHPDTFTTQATRWDPGTPDTIRLGGPRCNQTILDQENPEVPQTSLDQEIPEAPIIL
ncbi:hypothetical protein STEG23_002333 [Scotinomys teguina]